VIHHPLLLSVVSGDPPGKPTGLQTGETRARPTPHQSLLLLVVAVAQTPDEATGSLVRVGSEIGHRICEATPVRLDAVALSPFDAHPVNVCSVSETA
jgi:hypothetical protein